MTMKTGATNTCTISVQYEEQNGVVQYSLSLWNTGLFSYYYSS